MKTKTKNKRATTLLRKLQSVFPRVKRVVDATESIRVSVTPEDSRLGRKKDFQDCALAKACKRTKVAEGTVIGLAYSYLVNGTTATRYKTSPSVAREITSFDRHQDFAAGINYCLGKISPHNRLGESDYHSKDRDRSNENTGTQPQRKIVHRTSNVRHLGKM